MLKLYSMAEWLAFLCSSLLFAKGVKKEYRIFFFYTLVVVLVEYFGNWMASNLKTPNHLLFTFACFFFSCFYFFSIRHFLVSQKRRKVIMLFFLVFVLIYIVNLTYFQRFIEFNSYSFIVGYTFLAISCTFFYMEFINREAITPLWGEPNFFIVTGYFIYSVLTAILYTIHRYFAYLKIPDLNYRSIFQQINNIANVSLYILLSIAFIILWKKRKS
jgi:hypothetical protein